VRVCEMVVLPLVGVVRCVSLWLGGSVGEGLGRTSAYRELNGVLGYAPRLGGSTLTLRANQPVSESRSVRRSGGSGSSSATGRAYLALLTKQEPDAIGPAMLGFARAPEPWVVGHDATQRVAHPLAPLSSEDREALLRSLARPWDLEPSLVDEVDRAMNASRGLFQ
jgi:hypothetical protein